MNWNIWQSRVVMDAAETNGGGGEPTPEPAPEPAKTEPAPESAKAEATPAPEPAKDEKSAKDNAPAKTESKDDVPVPEAIKKAAETPAKTDEPAKTEKTEKPETKPAGPSDEDYTKAIKLDDDLKGSEGLTSEGYRKMIPVFREAGVSPEAANRLANAYTRVQIQQYNDWMSRRQAANKTATDGALKAFPEKSDWDSMGTAIRHFFKPGSAMALTLAHSEAGNDLELLALLKYAGEHLAEEGATIGGGAGSGKGKDVSLAEQLGI